jgi:predicted enzyme related to lactoylglutathione lyase
MPFAFQRRRGTTAQHASFTGLLGEVTVDTDKDVTVVHDGSTAGGFPMAKQRATTGTTSGATYTLALADANNIVTTTNTTGVTVTVPASVFGAGDNITILQDAAGQVTFAAGSGVTIVSTGATTAAPKIRAAYAGATVYYKTGGASPTVTIIGDIA